MKIILSHGKEGSPKSRKISRLQEIAKTAGHTTLVPDYRQIPSPESRANHLLEFLQNPADDCLLVGSSMGGYTSLVAAEHAKAGIKGIFLMSPAVYLDHYNVQSFDPPPCPIEVIHGWQDQVVPSENSLQFAKENKTTLLMLDDDHRLAQSLDEIERRFSVFLKNFESSG